ncbi:UNKNOWN [Stylonychia lemnae]|uniref:Uncharacterized protein n=1 Tax=Stylonychia lemnae TaxID=5949 RepID=A0A078AME5_STYLE|nr:UNKNOWN [Stylonychia lemnae]|eukprot:CDW82562.1 UNKNOWN [Stylonychia lemnae]
MRSFAITALLLAVSQAASINNLITHQRAQSLWRQEATNKFSWNSTQKLEWNVVNAFIDVQTSPDGDVFAIQKIDQVLADPKYFIYQYDISKNVWSIYSSTFQAKAVRFDRNANMYFLSPNNCIQNSSRIDVLCGVSDFEVATNNTIWGINDGSGRLSGDRPSSPFHDVPFRPTLKYKAYSGYKGLTLIRDEPIFIDSKYFVPYEYAHEKLVSISAGVDGSLWGLLYDETATDNVLVKWQTLTQKWYKVGGAVGKSLSAYNEISVALVDSKGLLSLSSQTGRQEDADYTAAVVSAPPPPRSLPPTFVSYADLEFMRSQIKIELGTDFSKFNYIFGLSTGEINDYTEIADAIAGKSNLLMIVKTEFNKNSAYFLPAGIDNDYNSQSVSNIVFSLSGNKRPFKQLSNSNVWQQASFSGGYFSIQNSQVEANIDIRCNNVKISVIEESVTNSVLSGTNGSDSNCKSILFYYGS